MCGRFNFVTATEQQAEDIRNMIYVIQRDLEARGLREGEIYPTNQVPVFITGMDRQHAVMMQWGFAGYPVNKTVINARSETVLDKRMFKDSARHRRCVIPSTGFFEWGSADADQQSLFGDTRRAKNGKIKYLFNLPGQNVLYMAGIYTRYKGEGIDRFAILTTEANQSMAEVHNRMPVVLRPEEQQAWLADDVDFEKLFDRKYITLIKNPA